MILFMQKRDEIYAATLIDALRKVMEAQHDCGLITDWHP